LPRKLSPALADGARLTVFPCAMNGLDGVVCVASPTMTQWIKIAEIGDVPPGAGRAFEVEGRSIAVFNVDGRLYAIDDSCPHQGSSLAMGHLEGYMVTCRSHGMKVNVIAGQGPGMDVRSFPVESRPDGLYVCLQASS